MLKSVSKETVEYSDCEVLVMIVEGVLVVVAEKVISAIEEAVIAEEVSLTIEGTVVAEEVSLAIEGTVVAKDVVSLADEEVVSLATA